MQEDSNYFDSPDDQPEQDSPPPQEQDGEQKEGQVQLGNIEAFPDAEPGKVFEVEIVRVLGKEVEYQVLGEKEEGAEKPPMEPEPDFAGAGEENMMN